MKTAPDLRIAARQARRHAEGVDKPVIHREEVVALLFNVSDIAVTLTRIDRHFGADDEEEEIDEG